MRNRGMIEGLEQRQLFSAIGTSDHIEFQDGHYTVTHADGTTESFDFDMKTATYAEAVAHSLLVIRFDNNGNESSMMTFVPPDGTRNGVFSLPTVKADGSTNVAGTDGADEITVEATTGVQETKNAAGAPADGEFDFVSAIDSATGKRYLASAVTGNEPAQYLENAQNTFAGAKSWLEHVKSGVSTSPAGDDLGEAQARFDAAQTQLARAQALADSMTTGRFVHYTLKGVYDFYVQIADDQPSTARVTVDSGAGSDAVTISPNVPMKSTIYGGSGADVLTTGKRTASVFAGGGKDRLINRSTKGATLDGGQGADRYYNKTTNGVDVIGRDDGDLMVTPTGSFTVFQASFVAATPGTDGKVELRINHRDGVLDDATLVYVQPVA